MKKALVGLGRLKTWQAYLFATLATAATFGLRFALEPQLAGRPTLVIFTLPIMLSAYVGGLRAGLLATALSYFGASYFLLPPIYSFAVVSPADRWQQFFVALAGVVISILNEVLHRTRRRADLATLEYKQTEAALQDSERRYRTLFEYAPDGIVIADERGVYLDANNSLCRMLGYTREEMKGKHSADVVAPAEVQFIEPALSEIKARSEYQREWRFRRKDGSFFDAEVIATTMPDGNVLGMIRDITERKQQEETSRKNLELEEQNRQVRQDSRLKGEFLANMSHELRTPLNAIIGFADLMHAGKVGPVAADHKEFLGDILSSARHLLQLINDVLDLAKIEAGKMEFRPEPVELPKLISEVCDVLRSLSAKRRILIQSQIDPDIGPVVIDPGKLKQVLYNYLSNALKFSRDEGQVTVRVKQGGAEFFRIEVEDAGIGIKASELDRLFVEFQQLDSSEAKKYQGTGLGLALTKRVVEAQGGQVGVRSIEGKGSTFFAILPRRAKGEEIVRDDSFRAMPAPKANASLLLVVEDDHNDLRWLMSTLGGHGYALESAQTGAAAIALCGQRKFDAITLDLLLPDMNGTDVLRVLRSEGMNQNTPVIIVTVVAEKGIGAGFHVHDILTKPVKDQELLSCLQRAGVNSNVVKPILVVDDDVETLKLAKTVLQQLGYRPICALDAITGLEAAVLEAPAAVVLDLLMPGVDGFEFLNRFRRTAVGRTTPVIVWTMKDLMQSERNRLKASVQAVVLKSEGTAALMGELRALLPIQPGSAQTLPEGALK